MLFISRKVQGILSSSAQGRFTPNNMILLEPDSGTPGLEGARVQLGVLCISGMCFSPLCYLPCPLFNLLLLIFLSRYKRKNSEIYKVEVTWPKITQNICWVTYLQKRMIPRVSAWDELEPTEKRIQTSEEDVKYEAD